MKILLDINHPADVHQFRHFIKEMEAKGHEFLVTARDKDVAYQLLDSFKIPYLKRKGYKGLFGKTMGMVWIDMFLYKTARRFRPDLLIGSSGNCYIAQVSRLIGKPSIIFSDTEFAAAQNSITFPFATKVVTPSCFDIKVSNQDRYYGYKELAYLHPARFKPDPKVKKKYSLPDKYIVMRLVEWQASHDVGYKGFVDVQGAVEKLEKHVKVVISSERKIEGPVASRVLAIAPQDMHSVLYYSRMLVGESSTMATEAAVLGKPAIFVSTSRRGYTDELEESYGMLFTFDGPNRQQEAVDKAIELLKKKDLESMWKKKQDGMLKEKCDVTSWMVEYVENFRGA